MAVDLQVPEINHITRNLSIIDFSKGRLERIDTDEAKFTFNMTQNLRLVILRRATSNLKNSVFILLPSLL